MTVSNGIKNIKLAYLIAPADVVKTYVPGQKFIALSLNIGPYDTVQVPLKQALYDVISKQITKTLENYIDPERFLKTLLNFGDDTQRIVTNWKLDPDNSNKLLIKLLEPLALDFDIGNQVFLSREVADTIVDTVKLQLIPQKDSSLWLRPKNTQANAKELLNNKFILNKTLDNIGISLNASTDNYGGASFENDILRRWYTDDYRSAELNIDYTNYKNFITYGSAELRLIAFKEKLRKIKTFEENSRFIAGLSSGSVFGIKESIIDTDIVISANKSFASPLYIAPSGSLTITSGTIVTVLTPSEIPSASMYLVQGATQQAVELENVIRSFDGYERYLFYGSGSAYSASAYYVSNGTEYNTDGQWPKKDYDNHLYTPDSTEAVAWFDTQLNIAQRYDDNNVNVLSNAIPSYLQEDTNSKEFSTFVKLIGHFLDNVKTYIDQLPNIYDRNVSATTGLSQDLVWGVAKSFGLELTNPHSATSLYEYITHGTVTQKRELTTELWKRFLHNNSYLNKTRGTKTSIKTLLNIFGLNEQVVGIRETDTATTGSFEIFDEVTNALKFNTGSYIKIPLSASHRPVGTIQFRFNNTERARTTLAMGDTGVSSSLWTVQINPHPSASSPYGRIEVVNNTGGIILSSSYNDMFDENYYDVMLRYNTSSINLTVAQSDGEEILYSSSMSTTGSYLCNAWPVTTNLYLGGSGSLSTNNFSGYMDEVRVWGEYIRDDVFIKQTLDPGSFAGNGYQSAVESLYTRLSFHRPQNLISGSIINESSYKNKDGVSDITSPLLPNITNFITYGFINNPTYPYSAARITRKIYQYTTNAGAYTYGSNKIIIASPPVFKEIAEGGIPVLHKNRSIVSIDERKKQPQSKKYIGLFVSPTDAVNNLILRSLGNVDIQNKIGYPGNRYKSSYTDLEQLQLYYKQYYNKAVNIAQFVRFFDDIGPALFEQVTDLIPAKAVLSSGVVIEPNILEHKKVMFDRPLKVSGENTRHGTSALITDRDIIVSTETTINIRNDIRNQSADTTQLNTALNLVELNTPVVDANSFFDTAISTTHPTESAEYNTLSAAPLSATHSIELDDIFTGLFDGATIANTGGSLAGEYESLSTPDAITSISTSVIDSNIALFDSVLDKESYINYLITYEQLSRQEAKNKAIMYKPGNIIALRDIYGKSNPNIIQTTLYNVIPPRADFEDYAVTNYFIKKNAIYYFETVYKQIINEKQLTFLTGPAATWSSGTTYNRNDVVTQDGATTGSAKYQNGKLFRYIAQDSPSISYNYPSLDKNRWVPLFYRGKAVQTPFRIIFDTNKGTGGQSVYELPVTRVSISRPIVQPKRYSTALKFTILTGNSNNTGTVRLQTLASLFSIRTSVGNVRIRLYDSQVHRDADISRPNSIEPVGNHGVLLDMLFDNNNVNETVGLYPPVTLINNDADPNSLIYYTVDELSGITTNTGLILTFNYFAIEAQILLPSGYLTRHYKFYRDTLLATKRRNYVGCLQTQSTTTDGRPPVEVTSTAGTTLTVSPNILQNEENLGGTNLNVN